MVNNAIEMTNRLKGHSLPPAFNAAGDVTPQWKNAFQRRGTMQASKEELSPRPKC